MKKKAQETGGMAAALVAIIALLIVLYILFLPPEDRRDILEEGSIDSGTSSSGDDNISILLEKNPGKLTYLSQNKIEHDINTINLYSMTEGKIIKEELLVNPQRSVFNEIKAEITFKLDNIENTDNVLFTFNVDEAIGKLIITLNGKQIFKEKSDSSTMGPIKLSKELLNVDNTLEFGVSSPGIAFWRTNEYTLKNVKVIADITDLSGLKSKSTFFLTEEEKVNLEKARLRYFANCEVGKVGKLKVSINSFQIFSGIPDCGSLNPIEFSPDYLNIHENNLEFEADSGTYLLDRIQIKTELKESVDLIYDFDINKSTYEDLDENYVRIKFEFADDTEDKEAEVIVNGHRMQFSTSEESYERNINNYVEEDINTVKIVPKKTMYIRKLIVEVVENDED